MLVLRDSMTWREAREAVLRKMALVGVADDCARICTFDIRRDMLGAVVEARTFLILRVPALPTVPALARACLRCAHDTLDADLMDGRRAC